MMTEENKVYMRDFEMALDEIKPSFGIDNSGLENRIIGGIYNYGDKFTEMKQRCNDFINEVRGS